MSTTIKNIIAGTIAVIVLIAVFFLALHFYKMHAKPEAHNGGCCGCCGGGGMGGDGSQGSGAGRNTFTKPTTSITGITAPNNPINTTMTPPAGGSTNPTEIFFISNLAQNSAANPTLFIMDVTDAAHPAFVQSLTPSQYGMPYMKYVIPPSAIQKNYAFYVAYTCTTSSPPTNVVNFVNVAGGPGGSAGALYTATFTNNANTDEASVIVGDNQLF